MAISYCPSCPDTSADSPPSLASPESLRIPAEVFLQEENGLLWGLLRGLCGGGKPFEKGFPPPGPHPSKTFKGRVRGVGQRRSRPKVFARLLQKAVGSRGKAPVVLRRGRNPPAPQSAGGASSVPQGAGRRGTLAGGSPEGTQRIPRRRVSAGEGNLLRKDSLPRAPTLLKLLLGGWGE